MESLKISDKKWKFVTLTLVIGLISISFFVIFKIPSVRADLKVSIEPSIYDMKVGQTNVLTADNLNGTEPYIFTWSYLLSNDISAKGNFIVFSRTNPAIFTLNQTIGYITYKLVVSDSLGNFGVAIKTITDSAALPTMTLNNEPYPGAPSYTVFVENDVYYAEDAYGAISFTSTNASYVIQSALDSQGTVILDNGIFNVTNGLTVFGDTVFSGSESTLIKYMGSGPFINMTGTSSIYPSPFIDIGNSIVERMNIDNSDNPNNNIIAVIESAAGGNAQGIIQNIHIECGETSAQAAARGIWITHNTNANGFSINSVFINHAVIACIETSGDDCRINNVYLTGAWSGGRGWLDNGFGNSLTNAVLSQGTGAADIECLGNFAYLSQIHIEDYCASNGLLVGNNAESTVISVRVDGLYINANYYAVFIRNSNNTNLQNVFINNCPLGITIQNTASNTTICNYFSMNVATPLSDSGVFTKIPY